MKILILSAVALSARFSVFAQGTIVFANRNIPTMSGTGGGNGNGTYNVPFYEYGTINNGAGDLPGGVTVGLFTVNGTLAGSSPLRTDAFSQFFAISAQTLTIPGVEAGTPATLTVRMWQGPDFAAAQAGGGQWGEWTFTSKPLGGTPPGGGLPITPPGMTGFGLESGAGLVVLPEPTTAALLGLSVAAIVLRRRGSDRAVEK